MLDQTDIERERHESRRKAQLDFNTAVKVARMEGRTEGRTEELIGKIQLCQRFLKQALSSRDDLARLPLEDLIRLAESLEAQALRQRE